MKLYLIYNINNINDFFSTGVISPKVFYEKREYGTREYIATKYDLNNSFITLYKQLPIDETEVLELNKNNLIPIRVDIQRKDEGLIEVNEQIFLYRGSLYIEANKVKIFASKEYYNQIIKHAEIVREVKLKNLRASLVVKEFMKGKYVDLPQLEKKNFLTERLVQIDKYLDKIKGFYLLNIDFNEKFLLKDEIEIKNYTFIIRSIEYLKELIKYNSNDKKGIESIKKIISKNNNIKILNGKKRVIKVNSSGFFKFNLFILDKEENEVFNVIMNILLNITCGHKGYYEKEEIYKILLSLKSALKKNEEYIKDLRNIYLRLIKDDISISVDSINNIVLKNFYVALLKYDNIKELKNMLVNKKIEKSIIAVSFVGIIIGYSEFGRSVSDVANSKFSSSIISREVINLQRILNERYAYRFFEKDNYKILYKLMNQKNLCKLIWNRNNITDIDIEFRNRGIIFNIILNNKYSISFYNKVFKNKLIEFKKNSRRLGLGNKINMDNKYKYFSYLYKENCRKLDEEEEKELNFLLKKILL